MVATMAAAEVAGAPQRRCNNNLSAEVREGVVKCAGQGEGLLAV